MNIKLFSWSVVLCFFLSTSLIAQVTTISGNVTDQDNGSPLVGVNIVVKDKVVGTVTDLNGDYNLKVNSPPPLTLVFSMVGYASVEQEITSESVTGLNLTMGEQTILGQEVVISASRIEESILESPVSIEKMDIIAVQQTATDTYYKALANLKGVDMTSSSINFQILNTRGFGSTGNVRFVQQTDGMDTQAPALNFPIGNLNGPSELDVESAEMLPGASSALYGPNAFNGILLVNSKNPFEYQGLSAFFKVGVNHINHSYQNTSPMYEASIRYAKAFNNRFAFKVNFSYMKADDWWGRNFDDRRSFLTPEGFSFNPGQDLVHGMGDEASINLAIFPLSSDWRVLARNEIYAPGLTAETYADAGDLPSHTVATTPYAENDIVDYGAENFKAGGSINYRVNDKSELSYTLNYGFGTTVYTGAQRYSLANFQIAQHKVEWKGNNFILRGYTTLENSGDSYIGEFLALKVNEAWSGGASPWLGGYGVEYLSYLNQIGLAPGEINSLTDEELIARTGMDKLGIQESAHQQARSIQDQDRFEPGTPEFENAKSEAREGVIPNGASFADKSSMIQFDGMYDFKNQIDAFDLQIGGAFRQFDLNSNGTIFADEGGLSINEYGGYVQFADRWADDIIKLVASIRYDKNQNFEGQINPRISTVITAAKTHNFRVSYQTGFRMPTTQNQYIDLDIVSGRLLGGLPQFREQYRYDENSYTRSSVEAYSQAVFDGGSTPQAILANRGILEESPEFPGLRPEQIQVFEVGYKSLINERLMLDVVGYYSIYNDFIGAYRVRKASGDVFSSDPNEAVSASASLLAGNSDNTFDVASNFDKQISAWGVAAGFDYSFNRGYTLGANYNYNVLDEDIVRENPQFQFAFNTPKHKYNVSFGNRKLTDKIGFNIVYRWQDTFRWESTFGIGDVDAVGLLDLQLTYRARNIKSLFKIGANNVLNEQYVFNYGGPEMGAIYYFSITFDQFMN